MLVTAHPRVVIHVPRPGHAHDGVDEQIGLRLACGTEGELLVCPVHGVACLVRHDLAPSQLAEPLAELARGIAQMPEVVMSRAFHAAQAAADVDRMRHIIEVGNAGVQQIVGSEHREGLGSPVGLPDVRHFEGRLEHALGVPQSQRLAGFDSAGEIAGDVQRDRHWPQRAIGEAHVPHHRHVVGASQESFQR